MKSFSIQINSRIEKFEKKIQLNSGCKSISHRFFLIASRGTGISKAKNILESEDILITIKALKKLGVRIFKKKNIYYCVGCGLDSFYIKKKTSIYLGNSGSTARMLAGLLSTFPKKILLKGDKSLNKRDMSRIFQLEKFGATFYPKNKKNLPMYITGSELPIADRFTESLGSAQVKSSLIFGALSSYGQTIIHEKFRSRNHTEIMLKECRAAIKVKKHKKFNIIIIDGKKDYEPLNISIPNDPSSAAFFVVIALLSQKSKIKLLNVSINLFRIGLFLILKKMGAKIKFENIKIVNGEKRGDIIAESSNLKSINCPTSLAPSYIDEAPLAFLCSAKSKGVSIFKGLGELNKKESRRLDVCNKILSEIGIKTKLKKDSIKIWGNPNINIKRTLAFNTFADHRIAMLCHVIGATLLSKGKILIKNCETIKTSFPNWFKCLKKINLKYEVKKKN